MLPTELLPKDISGRIDPIDTPGIDCGVVAREGRSEPVAGDGKRRRIRPLGQPRYHPDVLDGPAFENPAEMNFARTLMARAIGGMGDDLRIPIPNEPAIKLQLVRPVRCRLLGMQNGNQFVGGDIHRALRVFANSMASQALHGNLEEIAVREASLPQTTFTDRFAVSSCP